MHGERFCEHGAVGRFHYAVVCADLFPHGQPCTSTGCFLRLHDHFGDRFSHYGELVSIALFAVSSGMEQSYIDSFVRYYSSPGWLIFIILFTTICGFIGSLTGGRLMDKHFKKAGAL